jgi:hypothetical protein
VNACPLCPRRVGKTAFALADLCAEHLALHGPPIRAYEAAHPLVDGERRCTATCGCLTHDELLARLGMSEAEP